MKPLCRLAIVALLGGIFSSWAEAQVVPTVSITAPASVSTGATYLVTVAAADTSGHLLTLNVTRNGVYWGSASSIPNDPTRFNLSVSGNDTAPTTPGTISFYALVTSDSSSANASASVIVVDGTPPSVPAGLVASSLTTTSFTLNWTASTDNVGVTGYEVQQNSTSLGTVAVTNKAVSGLSPGITYAMTVRAKDAAANWSAWSSPLNVTTNKANQAAVTITSGNAATYGTTYTATATGGTGTGALVWALGTGSTASGAAIDPVTGIITANSNGTVVITVYRAADINYNASATTANYTVTFAKRAITVTLSGTKVYDGTTASTGTSATITTGSLAGSDTIGYVFAATSSANVAAYSGLTTATISNTAAPTTRTTSYTITYAGSYTITKANQTAVTISSSGAATYGTAYTATATGGLGTGALVWALGTGSTASGAAIASGTGAVTTTGSGLVVINVYRAASTNYNVSATTADFTVTFAGRPITVTLSGTKVYDGTTASTGASAARSAGTLAGTDTIAFAYAATSSANVGSYPGLATTTISNTVAPLTRTGSYAITNAGNYTITKANQAAVTITSAGSVTYGTAYTATATGGNGTGALVWALGTGSTATGAAINAATGVITANSSGMVVIKVSRAADTNYNVSATTANFTVTIAKVAITVTLSGTKAYNGTTASTGASAAITSGALVGTDTIGYAFAVTSSANAGTYSGLTTATISNTVAPTTRTTSYTLTYAGSYTITKINQAAVTITSSASATYGTAYTATATGGTGTGALVWALGTGSTASGAAINSATGVITAYSTGTVIFNVYRAADTNYNVSATTANFTVTAAKRLITVTLSGSKPYDGTTASTGASAAITTGTLGATDTTGYAYAATSSAAPGTYPGLATATISNVTAPTTRTGNYTITYAGNYTIAKAGQAAVTITSSSSGTYGTTYTATATGGSGTGALVWALGAGSTASGAAVNSATGVITATSSGLVVIKVSRAADADYNVSAVTADFPVTIAQRPITVTLSGSKTYNGTTASTGASAALTAGTLAGTDTIAYGYAAAGSANACSYPGLATATISNVAAPTARSGSYAITYAGNYTINPLAATFSLSVTSFFFNGAAQGPTVIPAPAGATFSTGGTLSATAVGSYTGTAAANGNYFGTNNSLNWSIVADTTAPTTPTGLASSNLTTTSFTLTWVASTDNVGVTGYTVYQNGVSIGTSATPTLNVTGLTASTTYNMTVMAQDAANNFSAASATLPVTTPADSGGVPTNGMRIWLRADMGVSVDGNGGVTSWSDQTGRGNTVTQSISTLRPVLITGALNSQPVVRFDGVSDYLDVPTFMADTQQGELFVLVRVTNSATRDDGLWTLGGADGTETEIIGGARHLTEDFGRSYRTDVGVPVVPLTNYVIYNVSAVAGDWTVFLNGQTQVHLTDNIVAFGTNGSLGRAVGKYLQGDIAEVMAYDHNMNAQDRAAVTAYLTTKYAVGGPAVPVITSALTATGTVDTALSPTYAITATNSPTSYNATGLPAGLSVNTATGVISGTPTATGTTNVTISATNAAGTGSATLVITINSPAAPVITSALTLGGTVNAALSSTYTITATNSPTSFNATGLPAGLSVNTATGVISGTPTAAGTTNVTISATNATGTGSATLVITIAAGGVPTAGLRLWLRADMGTTLDGNGGVSTWTDQSAAHNDATQGGAASRPLLVAGAMNGQPVLRFNGSGDNLALPDLMNGLTQGEIFIVTKLKDFTNAANPLGHFGGGLGTIYGSSQMWNDFGTNDNVPFASPGGLLVPHLFNASMTTGGTMLVQFNNVQYLTRSEGWTGFRSNPILGSDWQNEYFNGDMAEVIIYDHVLSTTDHAAVSSYLMSKYALGGGPSITSALTLTATVNTALSPTYTITATNSPTSYNATGLPAGLSVNTSTGVISGTPTATGTTNVTISATNASGTGSAALVITINPPAPVITSPLTLGGNVNSALSPTYTITASNSPTSFNAVGLPAGLSVNTATGVISGTPTAIGTTNVTISATNAGGTGSATLVITINASTVPLITSTLTKTGTVNVALSPTYTITATNSPTSYNAVGLPAGLSVNTATGVISGTPTAIATTNVTISATNASGTGSATLVITINPPPPVIISVLTLSGTINTALSPTYTITGSNSPTSFGAVGLPAGLSVNNATGVISGTPTAIATTNVTISATNAGGTGSATLVITVNPIATTFALSATSFTYDGAVHGPTVVPTPTGATFTTGGTLSATALGSYTATATANGNYSGTNNSLTWSIVSDTTPPSAPTAVAGSSFTATGFTLTWTASTDNIGVTGYTIYQNGVAVGTSTAPVFTLAGLTAATSYNMTVTAQDLAGNSSAASTVLAVATLDPNAAIPTAGMRMWLKADAGVVVDGANGVNSWTDQSAAHNNATTINTKPLLVAGAMNGKPVVRFDGAFNGLALPDVMNGATAGEIFIVAKLKDFTHASNPLAHFGGGLGTSYGTTQLRDDFGTNDSTPFAAPAGSVLTSPHLYDSSMAANGVSVIQLNNVSYLQRTEGWVGFRSNPLIGFDWQNEGFNGDIAEVIVYDRVLTTAERAGVAAYLSVKYGVVGPLDDPNGDADGDGLTNAQEINIYHTNPYLADTDGDGLPDGWEIAMGLNPNVADATGDLDGDGVPNNQDARPNNPAIGRLTIVIAAPANGSIQP